MNSQFGPKAATFVAFMSITFALVMIAFATARYFLVLKGLELPNDEFKPDHWGPALVTAFTCVITLVGLAATKKVKDSVSNTGDDENETTGHRTPLIPVVKMASDDDRLPALLVQCWRRLQRCYVHVDVRAGRLVVL